MNVDEHDRLWEVGKQVGLICRGEVKEVVVEFGCMEVRDAEVSVGAKLGGKNVSL